MLHAVKSASPICTSDILRRRRLLDVMFTEERSERPFRTIG
ncbi:hypothetical protein V5785_12220 [Bacillus subtilis]